MRHLKSVFNRMSLCWLPENENKNELECVGEFLCSFSLFLSKSIEVQSEFLPINNSEAAYKSIACQENRCFFLRGALRINFSTASSSKKGVRK